jgi:aminoglycoside phosphotransferase
MDTAGIGYLQRDNCFTWLERPEWAQQLMDQQLQAAWPELLGGIARSLNPLHEAMFHACPIDYYWSTYQSEWPPSRSSVR